MWEVWYGLEAANYLNDNGALVASLFFAIESLAEHEGWPEAGSHQLLDELVVWRTHSHLVIYQRLDDRQVVQVVLIKPD
ncbi:MAG: hypothetical protein ACK47M_00495 [Caldilinea sp.]